MIYKLKCLTLFRVPKYTHDRIQCHHTLALICLSLCICLSSTLLSEEQWPPVFWSTQEKYLLHSVQAQTSPKFARKGPD
jgi:hypothetical protein